MILLLLIYTNKSSVQKKLTSISPKRGGCPIATPFIGLLRTMYNTSIRHFFVTIFFQNSPSQKHVSRKLIYCLN